MKVMWRTNITIVCETEEAIKEYTDAALNFIASKRDEKDAPLIIGCEANEDNYLIADGDIEADKVAFEDVKIEPVQIPVSAVKGVVVDLSRVKIVEEPLVK